VERHACRTDDDDGPQRLPQAIEDRAGDLRIESFAARVDLKADRKSSTLIVHSAYLEPGRDDGDVAAALADELRLVARWLSLESIAIGRKGDLARSLKRATQSKTT